MTVNIKKDFGNTRNRKPDLTTLVYGKVPPQSIELEEAVLAACMLEKDSFALVLEIIQSPECFYVDAHQKIYAAMRELFDNGVPVDLLTITEQLKKRNELELIGGGYFLTRLTMSILSSAHVEAHARIVVEKFIQRELIRLSGTVICEAYEDSTDVFDLLDQAESNLYEITDKHLRKNFSSLQKIMVNTLNDLDEARKNKEDLTGVPSGYRDLDRLTNGWQKTDLIILAARPSVGKTAFALNLALNAAMNSSKQFPVAVFSLEMGAGQIVKRLMSCVSDIPMENISRGKLEEHEFLQLTQRLAPLSKAKIFIDDQAAMNIFELRAKARRLKQKHDIQLILIDYLQLMHGGDKNNSREQEVSKISRDLKALAKELEVPIIALSQLNRSVETRKENKIPQLSDLRESGAIEQDADLVMFLYRPEYYGISNDGMGESVEGEVQIHIAKHRNGATGMEKVQFIKEYQRFIDFPDSFNDFPGPQKPDDPRAGINANFGGSTMFIPGGFQLYSPKEKNWDKDDPLPF